MPVSFWIILIDFLSAINCDFENAFCVFTPLEGYNWTRTTGSETADDPNIPQTGYDNNVNSNKNSHSIYID